MRQTQIENKPYFETLKGEKGKEIETASADNKEEKKKKEERLVWIERDREE